MVEMQQKQYEFYAEFYAHVTSNLGKVLESSPAPATEAGEVD